ncbi:MAG: hypothetical protein QOG53_2353 [Frankiales bacterium]|jgi:hypothetical protein|nr:hypothetical protein [Frankiales bacterium]
MSRYFRRATVAAAIALAIPLTALVGVTPASAATDCTWGMSASWAGQPVTTVFYEGNTQCRIKVAMSGQARLLNKNGKQLSAGNAYSCSNCTYGASDGQYRPVFVGQKLILEFNLTIVLPSTMRWGGLPPECTGNGTRTLKCVDRQSFTVSLGIGSRAFSVTRALAFAQ